jgi:hypothetical protein
LSVREAWNLGVGHKAHNQRSGWRTPKQAKFFDKFACLEITH